MNVPTPVVLAAVFAAVYLFAVPIATFAHELGHAAALLALTGGDATVIVGGDRWQWTRGRLSIRVDPAGWRRQWYGFCRYSVVPSGTGREVAVHLAGPAASVAVLAVVFALAGVTDGVAHFGLASAFWLTASQVTATLAPVRYPSWLGEYGNHPSDGLQAWRALAGEA